MGSCISKCSPKLKKRPLEDDEEDDEFEHTQDKIVISQTTKTPISNKVSPFPHSPTSSSCFSSAPSFSGTTTTCTSASSCASSSVLTSKDRSFSNEFLWACVKENPHIIRINSIKEAALVSSTSKPQPNKLEPPPPTKLIVGAKKENPFTPKKKRGRSNSPTPLPRQKSFRKSEPERINSGYSNPLPGRTLKSPSPSRRFRGESGWGISSNTLKANGSSKRFYGSKVSPIHSISPSPSRRFIGESGWGISSNTSKANGSKRFNASSSKVAPINSVCSPPRKESFRPVNSSSGSSGRLRPYVRNRETCIHRITSKIDEIAVAAAFTEEDGDVVMEDFDNPLISLDCFIFL